MFFNPLLLGVAAAIDPVLIGAVAFMLTRRRPKRLLAVYLLGGFGVSMIAGVVALFALKDVGANKRSSVPPEIEIAVGALLLLAAVLVGTGLSARLRERMQARRGTHDEGEQSNETAALGTDPRVVGAGSTSAEAADVDATAEAQSVGRPPLDGDTVSHDEPDDDSLSVLIDQSGSLRLAAGSGDKPAV